ncbi:FecR family protein [Peristeroidobacter agariperforans]|uniref:FecR family protein n=1 Tax=Peristeroidobacter agariperforans TaxID=268404 RepID=UPI0013006071|nr:FecR domain-containing protein [Peristeroidobacter agariperforans]
MKDQSGVLIGVCRPLPDVLGFVTPVFRDRAGEPVAQIVENGRIVRFVELDLGEEFVPLKSFASVSVGEPALYGMEFEDCICVGSPGVSDWSDEDALKTAFENSRHDKSTGLLTFPHPQTRKRNLRMALAACVALLAFGLAFVVQDYLKSNRVIATDERQLDHSTLRDGTVVHLGALTQIKVDYVDAARIVYVHKGDVVFDVAKDRQRPFIARTDLVDITAVGTRFGVSVDSGVTTTVAEGSVTVTRRGSASGLVRLLKAGEELRVPANPSTSLRVEPANAERKLQWATGWLDLSGLTVAQGIEQLNLRNRMQIQADSPTISEQVVDVALVKVDSPKRYAKAVADELGVRMTIDEENGVIRLSE